MDSICCMDFSGDYKLVAAGMSESYIRVWTVDGTALTSDLESEQANHQLKPSASRRLIGHSGPVYAVSFSPATEQPTEDSPSTAPRVLLSCSADSTIRLWSLDTWTCLVAYKGHTGPVWDVKWSPHGHYFATASHDRTARLWATEHIQALRLFAGHDNDVDVITFASNNAYVFTGSCDRTVRMWDISRGIPTRMFTSHTDNITALACSPDCKTLASADDGGNIILWDIAAGTRIKRMRGHGKGGIWSLSWSVESSVLVSGGADQTVRVWDCLQKAADSSTAAGGSRATDGTAAKVDGMAGGVGGGKKKAKDVVVSPDQISAFPTKKSPVYKVMFTNTNLVLAGGAYLP